MNFQTLEVHSYLSSKINMNFKTLKVHIYLSSNTNINFRHTEGSYFEKIWTAVKLVVHTTSQNEQIQHQHISNLTIWVAFGAARSARPAHPACPARSLLRFDWMDLTLCVVLWHKTDGFLMGKRLTHTLSSSSSFGSCDSFVVMWNLFHDDVVGVDSYVSWVCFVQS